jgi:hypothetical protein
MVSRASYSNQAVSFVPLPISRSDVPHTSCILGCLTCLGVGSGVRDASGKPERSCCPSARCGRVNGCLPVALTVGRDADRGLGQHQLRSGGVGPECLLVAEFGCHIEEEVWLCSPT